MPWIESQKTETDIESFFESVLSNNDYLLFETYSEPNESINSFSSAQELNLDTAYINRVHGVQYSLWVQGVTPEPQPRTIDLNAGGKRFVIEGCGLFNIQLEAQIKEQLITIKIGYFTEAGALKSI